MASSKAQSVEQYLDELPEDRRAVISSIRDLILKNIPKGYQETMNWGMITYEIPLTVYPDTYNKQPLGYVALAAQKNYYALYLSDLYMSPKLYEELKAAFEEKGKKMDMGKACLRFKNLDDLPLKVLGKIIASTPPKQYIAKYEESRRK